MKSFVVSPDELQTLSPIFRSRLWKPQFNETILSLLAIDKINTLYRCCRPTTGHDFSVAVLDYLNIRLQVEIAPEAVLFLSERKTIPHTNPDRAFIALSNHPFGALDGIILSALFGSLFGDFKLLANAILMRIEALQECFFPVDPIENSSGEKINKTGLLKTWRHVKAGHPLGIFPAGSVSSLKKDLSVSDSPWRESPIKLIQQLQTPLLPIHFEGRNSFFFYLLGLIDWRLRSLRLPREVFRKKNSIIKIQIRQPLYPDSFRKFTHSADLAEFLKKCCYSDTPIT